jgi:hypothetical protein
LPYIGTGLAMGPNFVQETLANNFEKELKPGKPETLNLPVTPQG